MTPGHDPDPPPVLAPVVGGACLLWFLAGLALADIQRIPPIDYLTARRPALLVTVGGVTGPTIAAGEWWRLGTSVFVHGGAVHLLCNLYALAVIGPSAELVWGRRRTTAVFAVSALAAACAGVGAMPTAVVCGVSGAICGLLAAIVVWLLRYGRTLPPADARRSARRVGLTVLLGAAVTAVPGVSWEGHLAGALAGAAAAFLLDRRRRLAALLVAAVSVGGLLAAVVYAPTWRPVCRAVATARLAPLHWSRVTPLATDAQAAAISGIRPRGLSDRAARLATTARTASAGWVPAPELVRQRTYARAVAELLDVIAADRIDLDALRAKRQAAEQAWAAVMG